MYCASLDAVCAAVVVLQGECRGTNLGPVGGAAVNKEATAPQQRVSTAVVHAPLLLISTLSWQVFQTDLSAVLCDWSALQPTGSHFFGETHFSLSLYVMSDAMSDACSAVWLFLQCPVITRTSCPGCADVCVIPFLQAAAGCWCAGVHG
jgi:hypothetical protein